jgi:hypothetical protein
MRGVLPLLLMGCVRVPTLPERADLLLAEHTVDFADRTWWLRDGDVRAGAGPGWWSSRGAAVVDGALHLSMTPGPRWRGVELMTPLPPGRHTVEVDVEVSLPPDVIAGLFRYRSDTSELDVELGQWGDPGVANAQYAIGPASRPGNVWRFDTKGRRQTHRIAVAPGRVDFESRWEGGDIHWTYEGPDQPQRAAHALHLNLWSVDGVPDGPAELVVHDVRVR